MSSQPDSPRANSEFSVLLTPVRELEANWNVDVAEALTRYATVLGIELPDIELDDNPSNRPVDFAEAALVVQGSTSIYSRKVEHLYNLVYNAVAALNQLRGKEKKAGNGSSSPNGKDDDADALFNIDEVDFLTLDDIVKLGDPRAINLVPERLPAAGSLDDPTCLRPVPPMLIQGRSADERKLGSANFKVLTSQNHPSGAMIMEGCPPVDENLDAAPEKPSFEQVFDAGEPQTAPPLDSFDDDHDDNGDPDDAPLFQAENSFAGDENAPPFPSQTANNSDDQGNQMVKQIDEDVKPERDPLEMLDPHLEMKELEKPIHVAKTYRRPRKSRPDCLWGWSEKGLTENLADKLSLHKIPPSASIKTYVSTTAARAPVRKLLRKRMARTMRATREEYDSDLEVEEMRSACGGDQGLAGDVQLEDVQLFGTDDFNNDDNLDDAGDDLPLPPMLNEENSANLFEINDELSLEAPGTDHILQLASSYEETCRKYLEKTAWMWEQKVMDTKLVKRVETWTSRIQPILAEEEQRKEFDIREYGQKIVDRFRDVANCEGKTETRMSNLLKADARHEACRMFLASLQLANNYSIEIVEEDECKVADPVVKLLESCGEKVFTTPKARSKRTRDMARTPVSARRQPLRQRTDNVILE